MSAGRHSAVRVPRTRNPAHAAPRGRPISFGFVPALDGMRAIAVFGVMLYHGGAPGVGGGFLGVNVFFVLSGFLITSLLLGEWTTRLTIRLGEFWARRARRLLPALLVLLVGVAIYAKVFASPGQFPNLRLDTLSSLFYVANWHFIFAGSSYFDQTVTSPLAHMWSLAIEAADRATVGNRLGRQCAPSPRPHGQRGREDRTDQDVLAPGIGPFVEAGDRGAVQEEEAHPKRGAERTGDGDGEDRPELPARAELHPEAQQHQHDGGPHDVELLFDRE